MEKTTQQVWQEILKVLDKNLNNQVTYGMLSAELHPLELDDTRFVLGVPNDFTLRNIHNRYLEPICSAAEEVLGNPINVSLAISRRPEIANDSSHRDSPRAENTRIRSESEPVFVSRSQQGRERLQVVTNLNARYNFGNFVVGSHNKFAHATAWRVAEEPGQAYNPLFIYGGVGLGKTHLMQAIGNQILQRRDDFKVTYISSERFTNELINSLKDGTTLDFKNRYRSVDLLLIDDIQFIGGKETTQEEFFHTFNELHEAGKQIVITSDRPPNEISTLEHRLRSRFQMGLICDIQPPDFETRIAILKKKAEMDGLDIPDEVLHYVARVYKSNVRELEGALVKLMAFTSMTGTDPDMSLAQSVLGQMPDREVNTDMIAEITADYFELKLEDMRGKSREKKINQARQVAIYICRELTDLSLPKIGEYFGNRDHSTILNAYHRIRKEMLADSKTENIVNNLIKRLR